MNRIFSLPIKVLIIFSLISFYSFKVYAEEIETILNQLQEDIKTLEDLIEVEGEVHLERGYGKKVKEWITYLISKSTD